MQISDTRAGRDHGVATSGESVRRHVEAGDAGFTKMWNELGGTEYYERRKWWWATQSGEFEHRLH
jgi:hypothetical protein